jgi:hydroxyethylthiazole kinase-like uncharacterized protein yjeF
MKTILTPEQMKSVDEYAIKKLRIPSLRLMENAGKTVVDEIIDSLNTSTRSDKKHRNLLRVTGVLIFCGKGNNGGDGFVVARLLVDHGFAVVVVLMESEKELNGDGRVNYQRLQDCKITKLQILRFEKFQELKNKNFDIIVDAMLGTAFRGELKGNYRKAIEWCNKQSSLKIAVDIPTGLNGETGEVRSQAFQADVTVTMSTPKIGFYKEGAQEFTGEVVVADIGIPKKAISNSPTSRTEELFLVEESDVRKTFPKRASNSHKHSVGKIFALAGSKSMMGAALLCSQSAMRSGAGQLILGIPDSEYEIIAKRTLEVMPLGLPSTNEGSLSYNAIDEIRKRIDWADVLLLGCGLSGHNETQRLIRELIKNTAKPIVIDADGLNALVGNLDVLKNRKSKNVVLTPHRGEFSRLIGIPSKEIEQNKFSLAANFVEEYNLILIMKGAPTFIATPSRKIIINSTGNSGMSTAGSGDVLAGIIASLIGQGNSISDSAVNGVFVHGRAGDITAAKLGIHGMIASDMIKNLPIAITSIIGR